MALYTRKGDGGTTKTLKQKPGERVSKASLTTEALGALDELNSFSGFVKMRVGGLSWTVDGKEPSAIVRAVQGNLFIVQAELAGAEKTIKQSKVGEIEMMTDEMEKQMPPIKTFFVSGGTEEATLFDVARTLARRAEREVVRAIDSGEATLGEHTRSYLNRLSTLFYALARYSNFRVNVTEESPNYE